MAQRLGPCQTIFDNVGQNQVMFQVIPGNWRAQRAKKETALINKENRNRLQYGRSNFGDPAESPKIRLFTNPRFWEHFVSFSWDCVSRFMLQGQKSNIVKIGQKLGSRSSREIGGKVGQKERILHF